MILRAASDFSSPDSATVSWVRRIGVVANHEAVAYAVRLDDGGSRLRGLDKDATYQREVSVVRRHQGRRPRRRTDARSQSPRRARTPACARSQLADPNGESCATPVGPGPRLRTPAHFGVRAAHLASRRSTYASGLSISSSAPGLSRDARSARRGDRGRRSAVGASTSSSLSKCGRHPRAVVPTNTDIGGLSMDRTRRPRHPRTPVEDSYPFRCWRGTDGMRDARPAQ